MEQDRMRCVLCVHGLRLELHECWLLGQPACPLHDSNSVCQTFDFLDGYVVRCNGLELSGGETC